MASGLMQTDWLGLLGVGLFRVSRAAACAGCRTVAIRFWPCRLCHASLQAVVEGSGCGLAREMHGEHASACLSRTKRRLSCTCRKPPAPRGLFHSRDRPEIELCCADLA